MIMNRATHMGVFVSCMAWNTLLSISLSPKKSSPNMYMAKTPLVSRSDSSLKAPRMKAMRITSSEAIAAITVRGKTRAVTHSVFSLRSVTMPLLSLRAAFSLIRENITVMRGTTMMPLTNVTRRKE